MKGFSNALKAVLSSRYAGEPLNVIGVQWADGTEILYSDKDIESDNIFGRILQLGEMETVIGINKNTASTSISVKLDDTDGHLKGIYDTLDIHGRPVKIYQVFGDLPISEKVLIYEGVIASPVVWDEGERTLSFSVQSKLADAEVGFSPEEGYFPDLPPNKVGKPWPLCFGLVSRVPATSVSDIPKFDLGSDLQAVDPSLIEKIEELRRQLADMEAFWLWVVMAEGAAASACDFGGMGMTPEEQKQACSTAQQLHSLQLQIVERRANMTIELAELNDQFAEQTGKATGSLLLSPQTVDVGQVTTIEIGNNTVYGSYNQNTGVFTVGNVIPNDYIYDPLSPYGFVRATAGTPTKVKDGYLLVKYVANILPSTVKCVEVFNKQSNSFVQLSSKYWSAEQVTLNDEDFETGGGEYTCTVITLTKPPSSIDTNFDDDIYVSLESSVGPNPVDIIQWLVEKYTDFQVDSSSFAECRTLLDTWPMDFAMLQRKNIITVLQELAWQAKCAIWISKNTVYMKYLSKKYPSEATITLDDIDAGSLKIVTTNTEDLVTKFVANWVANYSSTEKNSIILRHNVSKYGTHEQTYDMYAYTIQELVAQVATFWLIRYSNCWKVVEFTTPIHLLELDAFDTITLNLDGITSTAPVDGIIETVKYDSQNLKLTFTVWIPVKLGTMVEYDFAQPCDIDVTLTFPTPDEIEQGLAGSNGPGEDNIETKVNRNINIISSDISRLYQYEGPTAAQKRRRPHYGTSVLSEIGRVKYRPNTTYSEGYTPAEPHTAEYAYGDHSGDFEFTETEYDLSAVYPAQIKESLGEILYCTIYVNGLNEPPLYEPVKQLQIGSGGVFPVDTWCLVVRNRKPKYDENTGEITYEEEWTAQVPIWL